MLHIPEIFGHGQAGQGYAHTHSRRLIHLAEHQRGVLQHAHFFHFEEEVGALTGAFAHASEHGGAGEFPGDTGNHFLNEHGLTHASTAEQANLAALHIGGEQVDDLNAGFQDFGFALQLVEWGRVAVDAPLFTIPTKAGFVQAIAQGVKHVAFHHIADGHGDGAARVGHHGTPHQAVGGRHGDGAHQVIA